VKQEIPPCHTLKGRKSKTQRTASVGQNVKQGISFLADENK
jgi:hypothetical protein